MILFREVAMQRALLIATLSLTALAAKPLSAQQPPPSGEQSGAQSQATRAAADVDMDAMPTLDAEGVRKVQLALQKKGIDPGPIDGILGPLTKGAVRTFQSRYGIKASGDIDNQTLFALGEVDLAG
jgi:peptidoglycan hydrolase-like protein with peptidoglycan-binding domain